MDLESEGVDAVAIDRVVAEYRMQRQKENLPFWRKHSRKKNSTWVFFWEMRH